jgi:hypothetical protein
MSLWRFTGSPFPGDEGATTSLDCFLGKVESESEMRKALRQGAGIMEARSE